MSGPGFQRFSPVVSRSFAQVCAVCSPPSTTLTGDFECNGDVTTIDQPTRVAPVHCFLECPPTMGPSVPIINTTKQVPGDKTEQPTQSHCWRGRTITFH